MKKELAKTYNPKEIEGKLYEKWCEKKYFHAEVDEANMTDSEISRWVQLDDNARDKKRFEKKGPQKEIEVTQEMRQKHFDNWETTDDHGMVIEGIATDQEGNRCKVVFVQRDTAPDDIPELEYPTFEPGQKRTLPTQEEGYYPVIVETGIADTQNVEIKSGVNDGDTVFLNYTLTDYSYG